MEGRPAAVEVIGDSLYIKGAGEITIYLTALTDFAERLECIREEKDYVPGELCGGCPEGMAEKAAEVLAEAAGMYAYKADDISKDMRSGGCGCHTV